MAPSKGSLVLHTRTGKKFQMILLRNHWANQNQISYGVSMDRGHERLFAASGSHDQDGRHAHIG